MRCKKFINYKIENQERFDEIYEDEFCQAILWYVLNYDVPVGDFLVISSYGIVDKHYGESIVLVYYGLDDNILKQHYS